MKTWEEIQTILKQPTPADQILFRPQVVGDGWAVIVAYLPRQFYTNRLDSAVGVGNWKVEHAEIKGKLYTTISIRPGEGAEWVSRSDTGEDVTKEPKAVVTSGIKRAATLWGIGEDVSLFPTIKVNCKTREVKGNGKTRYEVVNYGKNSPTYQDFSFHRRGNPLRDDNRYEDAFHQLCAQYGIEEDEQKRILDNTTYGYHVSWVEAAYQVAKVLLGRAAVRVKQLKQDQEDVLAENQRLTNQYNAMRAQLDRAFGKKSEVKDE